MHISKLVQCCRSLPVWLLGIWLAVPAVLQAATGVIEIESVPPGAEVFIDNIAVGKTPYTDTEIETGGHNIRVHYSDAFPDKYWHVLVDDITPLRKTFYFTHLEKGMVVEPEDQGTVQEFQGNVQIASIPAGAGVYLNDEWQGQAPLGIKDLPVGHYELKMEHGLWSGETDFPIMRGKTTKVVADIRKNRIRVSAPGRREKQYIHMDVSFYLSRVSRETISSLVVDIDRDTGQARGIFWSPVLYNDQDNHPVRGRVNRRGRSLSLTLYDTLEKSMGTAYLGGTLGRAVATDSFKHNEAYDERFRLSGYITFSGRMYRILSKDRKMPLLPQYLVRTATTPYDYHDFLPPEGEEKDTLLNP